jgi:hypothetical protein
MTDLNRALPVRRYRVWHPSVTDRSLRLRFNLAVAAVIAAAAMGTTGPVGMGRVSAAEPAATAPGASFLAFVRAQAAELRRGDAPSADLESWKAGRGALRERFLAALGEFPRSPCQLEPQVLGTTQHDGYRIERLLLQTLPGVRMTANAYVPEPDTAKDTANAAGKRPAVLCVHGHWRLAKQEPVVQARCIGLAKLGFFVLVVDAFGAGERAIGKALGEYHGEMAGALLFPSGWTLAGVQWYENSRAIDYLRSRPEVDADRIGVTGASGGGNQSMYCGTLDERIAATIPVCSVGNYQAYLGAACCMCEVVPGALRFAEEGDLLGLAAPRALMVINATGDAPQFSVLEAKKSLGRAGAIFQHYGRGDAVRHTIIESGHDYNRPMREAMYGWVMKHLAGRGDGAPIAEGELKTVDPETLRCYPGESRPDDFVTLPRFAAAEARRVLAALPALPDYGPARSVEPKSAESKTAEPKTAAAEAAHDAWRKTRAERLAALRDRVLNLSAGGAEASAELSVTAVAEGPNRTRYRYVSEPGVTLEAVFQATDGAKRTALLVDARPPLETLDGPLAKRFIAAGWHVYVPEVRAVGRTAVAGDQIGRAPDHNSAEWSLWIGRPLLGQWVIDIAAANRALRDSTNQAGGAAVGEVTLVGVEQMGPAALVSGALADGVRSDRATGAAVTNSNRFAQVVCVDGLVSYVSEAPYQGQRLGIVAPGLLKYVGDIAHLAALVEARRVVFAGGRLPAGGAASPADIAAAFSVIPSGRRPQTVAVEAVVENLSRD